MLMGQVGVNGCLQEIKIIRTLGYGLDESAMYAVKRWRIKPFQENGKPTVKNVQIELDFDPRFSPDDVDLPTKECGDYTIGKPSRPFARLAKDRDFTQNPRAGDFERCRLISSVEEEHNCRGVVTRPALPTTRRTEFVAQWLRG